MKFTSRCAVIAQRFKPPVSYQEVRTFDPSSAHLCMCLVCMCVSSNNKRSNTKPHIRLRIIPKLNFPIS
jgi:hypothetical protein